jgi:hypothetical protein
VTGVNSDGALSVKSKQHPYLIQKAFEIYQIIIGLEIISFIAEKL